MEKTKKVLKIIWDIFKKIILFLIETLKKTWSVKGLRPIIIVIIIILIMYIKITIDQIGNESKTMKEYANFTWPSNQLVNTIEKYKSFIFY